jgi:glycosylphosphatidylinositol transamidase (GPIT) subunit GPI8
VAVIDRYTYYNLEFLETEVKDPSSKKTLGDLFDSYDDEKIHSHAGVRYDLFPGGEKVARERLLMDFFGNVQNVEVDGVKNDTEWREDLLLLSKKISTVQERTEATKKSARVQSTLHQALPAARLRATKVEADNGWWGKKVIGAWALAGCTLAWVAGTYLEAAK